MVQPIDTSAAASTSMASPTARDAALLDSPMAATAAKPSAFGERTSTSSAGAASELDRPVMLRGVYRQTGQLGELAVPGCIVSALVKLGIAGMVGSLRLAKLPGAPVVVGTTEQARRDAAASPVAQQAGNWLPLSVQFGMPLCCLPLCKAVCLAAREAGFLSQDGRAAQAAAQMTLQAQLEELEEQFSEAATPAGSHAGPGNGSVRDGHDGAGRRLAWHDVARLPSVNLLFDSVNLSQLVGLGTAG
ncbi:hypothetical protein QJQ45_019835 [Haematococcus lacustris]|nr:hypothetical protein QJQ45_019835 [Haematococcus lacustris]